MQERGPTRLLAHAIEQAAGRTQHVGTPQPMSKRRQTIQAKMLTTTGTGTPSLRRLTRAATHGRRPRQRYQQRNRLLNDQHTGYLLHLLEALRAQGVSPWLREAPPFPEEPATGGTERRFCRGRKLNTHFQQQPPLCRGKIGRASCR